MGSGVAATQQEVMGAKTHLFTDESTHLTFKSGKENSYNPTTLFYP